MIAKPLLGKITQGDVFAGAYAEAYLKFPVWGICITARCDVAHDKAPVFNYLPIVRFEDWMRIDGRRLLCELLQADCINAAQNRLKQRQLSSSLLDSYTFAEIAEKFFPVNSARPDREALQFQQLTQKLDEIRAVASVSNCDLAQVSKLTEGGPKIAERLMRDLIKGALTGYYFLDSVGDTEHPSDHGYVILMREIHHVASDIVRRIADGVDRETWLQESKSTCLVPNFSVFDFALPIARVTSPKIEHILQAFGLLFMRIGVPDPDPSIFNKLQAALSHE